MRYARVFSWLSLVSTLLVLFSSESFAQAPDYVPHTVIVKLGANNAARGDSEHVLSEDALRKLEGIDELNAIPYQQNAGRGVNGNSILAGIYKINLDVSVNELAFIASLQSYKNLVYAERYPNVQPLLVPNDAGISGPQYYLEQIKAYDAWDISQGSEAITIAIIDTGVDLDHEDLVNNLSLNEDEIPDDGIDNDNDGYVDNDRGWDFADDDNVPEADGDQHGTLVTGIAAASTNNNMGIAGVGYRTKFLPIKIFATQNNFSQNSYEGIIYAADQGCEVINLSWGGTSGFSQFAQDVINYAVLEKNAVVVAAAGNTNAKLNFYPASYNNVLSVAFVDANDRKAPNATFSNFIDISGPGIGIFTTYNNDDYGFESGSSLSAPMVAGAAALLRARFPAYSAIEIMEQLRITADDIYEVAGNEAFRYQFGKGRLNTSKAISATNRATVRISHWDYNNGFEKAAYYGDTLNIDAEFTAYLNSLSDFTVTISSESPYVHLVDSVFSISALARNENVNNHAQPFTLILYDELPENEQIYIRFNFEGLNYSDYQYVLIPTNPKTQAFDFNNWFFALNANGVLGANFDFPQPSLGVYHNDTSIIKHSGIVIATSADSVSRNTLINPAAFTFQGDFTNVQNLKRFNDITADLDVRSIFKEKESLGNRLGIQIRQRVLGWHEESALGYLITEYELENRSDKNYDSLYFNLFTQWFIAAGTNNTVQYDSANQLVYAFNESAEKYGGLALMSQRDSIYYPLNLANLNGHISDLQIGELSNNVIIEANKQAFAKVTAGEKAGGNLVGSLLGILRKNFLAGQSEKLHFVLLTGNSLSDLQNSLSLAKSKIDLISEKPPLGQQLFICKNDQPIFNTLGADSIRIYTDPLIDTPIYAGRSFEMGNINNDSTLYYQQIDASGFSSIRKRLVIKLVKPEANFIITEEPYLLSPESDNLINFEDASINAVTWRWQFENGYTSINRNPVIPFDEEGAFEVRLIVTNQSGCTDTISKEIITAFRSKKPIISDNYVVCKGGNLQLSDPTITQLTFYADSLATELVFEGAIFELNNIQSDTSFYVRNESAVYPSEMIGIKIAVAAANMPIRLVSNFKAGDTVMTAFAINQNIGSAVSWLLRDEIAGTADTLLFNLDNFESGDLKLVTENSLGCIDTIALMQAKSPLPIFESYTICQQEAITLKALNTDEVFYYADQSLTTFLGSGSQLTLTEPIETPSVYAVNVEDVVPSEPVKIPLEFSELIADFTTPTDTVNIAFDELVTAEAYASTAINFSWDLGNGTTKSGQKIELDYQEAGVYTLTLTVQDSLFCEAVSSKRIVVFDNPILGNKAQLADFFRVFPNPANQFLHLTGKHNFSFDSYKIFNTNGVQVLSKKNDKPKQRAEVIATNDLVEGVYFLEIYKNGHKTSFMFLINR